MHHILKLDKPYVDPVFDGFKTFEIRRDDRGFQKGDTVSFRCETKSLTYGDPEGLFEITYVTSFKQCDGYVVFGIKDTHNEQAD